MTTSRTLCLACIVPLLALVSACPNRIRVKPIAAPECNNTKAELFIGQEGADGVASSALIKSGEVEFRIGATTSSATVLVAGHVPSPAPPDRRLRIYTGDPVTLTLKLRCSLGSRKFSGVLEDYPRQKPLGGGIIFTLPFDKFLPNANSN